MANSSQAPSVNKEPWLAVNLSKLLLGLGQIYACQFQRGIIILLLHSIITFLAFASIAYSNISLIIGCGLLVFGFIFWIWNMQDSYQCASKQNTVAFKESQKHRKDPWIAIFWSSFIPGLGHFYLKKPWIGALLLVLTVILAWIPVIGFIWYIIVVYLSYISASGERKLRKVIVQFVAISFVSALFSILIAFVTRIYIAEARYIPAGSMEPTLQINDRLIISKVDYYFDAPKRGDIIVFNPTQTLKDQGFRDAFIKRVIGISGDRIEIQNGSVLINNQRLLEPYVLNGTPTLTEACGVEPIGDAQTALPAFLATPVIIPKDGFLVLGDNRNNSYDGRCWGLVSKQDIIGKATKFFWPINRIGTVPQVDYPNLPR